MSTYLEDKAAGRAQIRLLAEQAAPWLPGFVVAPPDPEDSNGWDCRVFLRHPDGRAVQVGVSDKPGMVACWGVLPPGETYWKGRQDNPSIKVGISRGGQALAGEITRRLLPGYREVCAKTLVFQAEEAADRLRMRELVHRIAYAFPGLDTVRDDTVYPGSGTFRVNRDGRAVTVDLRAVSPELAVRIARLLAAETARDRAAA